VIRLVRLSAQRGARLARNPTVSVTLSQNRAARRRIVPSARSTGKHEALELRDGDPNRYGEGSAQGGWQRSRKPSQRMSSGMDISTRRRSDAALIGLDETSTSRGLGANAILGVSLRLARCGGAGDRDSSLPISRWSAGALAATPDGEPSSTAAYTPIHRSTCRFMSAGCRGRSFARRCARSRRSTTKLKRVLKNQPHHGSGMRAFRPDLPSMRMRSAHRRGDKAVPGTSRAARSRCARRRGQRALCQQQLQVRGEGVALTALQLVDRL